MAEGCRSRDGGGPCAPPPPPALFFLSHSGIQKAWLSSQDTGEPTVGDPVTVSTCSSPTAGRGKLPSGGSLAEEEFPLCHLRRCSVIKLKPKHCPNNTWRAERAVKPCYAFFFFFLKHTFGFNIRCKNRKPKCLLGLLLSAAHVAAPGTAICSNLDL